MLLHTLQAAAGRCGITRSLPPSPLNCLLIPGSYISLSPGARGLISLLLFVSLCHLPPCPRSLQKHPPSLRVLLSCFLLSAVAAPWLPGGDVAPFSSLRVILQWCWMHLRASRCHPPSLGRIVLFAAAPERGLSRALGAPAALRGLAAGKSQRWRRAGALLFQALLHLMLFPAAGGAGTCRHPARSAPALAAQVAGPACATEPRWGPGHVP